MTLDRWVWGGDVVPVYMPGSATPSGDLWPIRWWRQSNRSDDGSTREIAMLCVGVKHKSSASLRVGDYHGGRHRINLEVIGGKVVSSAVVLL